MEPTGKNRKTFQETESLRESTVSEKIQIIEVTNFNGIGKEKKKCFKSFKCLCRKNMYTFKKTKPP